MAAAPKHKPNLQPSDRRHNAGLGNAPSIAVDLTANPPDAHLIQSMGARACLRYRAVPVKRLGGATLMATSQPESFADLQEIVPESFGDLVLVTASQPDIERAITTCCGAYLSSRAEQEVAEHESCRFWYDGSPRRVVLWAAGTLALAGILFPLTTFLALFGWAFITLIAMTMFKLAALWPTKTETVSPNTPKKLPTISVMIPLFRESDILERLVQRLSQLDYPEERLDICLVTEGDDVMTRRMLAQAALPKWVRVVTVPPGQLRTKPRALNFALDFCHGTIIGIWDAEDAPSSDQLRQVAAHFSTAPPEVACLQGALDYYNPEQNWLTRCFTVEYGAWWRVILPGVARLGFVLPLGGTTLFFRREALERLHRWDAHNVTEDADLGIRLARHGFRTELIPTTTHEEATSRVWPWVRQRSRWIKGFMMTWTTHMRFPGLLIQELGPWRFCGLQLLFLGSLSQVLLAPLLWSIWAVLLGLGHPLTGVLSSDGLLVLATLFLLSEAVTIATGILGAIRSGKAGLWPWVPSLHLYYPLATLAAYKALWELVFNPFYWDKTQHGLFAEDSPQTSVP